MSGSMVLWSVAGTEVEEATEFTVESAGLSSGNEAEEMSENVETGLESAIEVGRDSAIDSSTITKGPE